MKDGRSLKPSVGIDLVEYAQARALLRAGEGRLRRILTATELSYVRRSRRPEKALACVLAGKEAVFKSLGSFWMGPDNFQNIHLTPSRESAMNYRVSSRISTMPVRRAGTLTFRRATRYVVATCAGT